MSRNTTGFLISTPLGPVRLHDSKRCPICKLDRLYEQIDDANAGLLQDVRDDEEWGDE